MAERAMKANRQVAGKKWTTMIEEGQQNFKDDPETLEGLEIENTLRAERDLLFDFQDDLASLDSHADNIRERVKEKDAEFAKLGYVANEAMNTIKHTNQLKYGVIEMLKCPDTACAGEGQKLAQAALE